MRPEILFSLFAPVTSLPGVGPRIAKAIATLAGPHVADLLWHLPSGLIDRRFAPRVSDAPAGAVATMTVQVIGHDPPRNPRLPYKVLCSDETGELELVFFHARPDFLRKVLPEGETRVVSGKVEHYRGRVQITHPDHIAEPDEVARLQTIEPVYPLTTGLTPKPLGRAVRAALERAPALPEWNDPAWMERQGWQSWRDALLAAHAPGAPDDIEPDAAARRRLAYDELLASQLAIALVRARQRRLAGRSISGDGGLMKRALASLPFTLTPSQTHALDEITADMATGEQMLRLLQGDVGSGKTVVAFLAMVQAVDAGCQAALMAPTEVLARQHFATIEPLATAAGLETVLLTGRDKGKAREAVLAGLAAGDIAIAIGTHALFQDDIAFRDLAFAVIDEQHRFGVHQRLLLAAKGREADMLVMGFTRGDSQFSQVYRSSKPFLMRGLNAHCCNLPSQL